MNIRTFSSCLEGSNIILLLSVTQQHIATAEIRREFYYFLTKWNLRSNQKTITNKSLLPARCLRGIPASTSAAHAAFIAHGRS